MVIDIRNTGIMVILVLAAWKDYKTLEIPDLCHITAILWWCAFLLCNDGTFMKEVVAGITGGVLIAGGLLLFSTILERIVDKEMLGGGDIKLFFVTGLYLGPAGNWLNLMISSMLGLAFGISRRRKGLSQQEAFPFAPFIAASTGICMMFGETIISWYLSLF